MIRTGSLILFIHAALLFLNSCANQVTPTGGKTDETPPVVNSVHPDTNSVFFTADEIVFEFDEYIQATDVFNQVVISPPLENAPEIKVKGKKLIVKLNNTLRDSTTYTINFGESIKNISENIVLDNFTYAFSTGSYIDSLTVSGNVNDILTGKSVPKIYAVLYPAGGDSSFTSTKPYYFAKTNAAGDFTIRNIRSGDYDIYAIEDQNFNYYYDLPNERIAFLDSTLHIDSNNITNIDLHLFSEELFRQQLLSAKSYRYGQSQLAFAANTDTLNIQYAGSDSADGFFERNKSGDTIIFWHPDIYLNEHVFHIRYDTIDTLLHVQVKALQQDSDFLKNINDVTDGVVSMQRGTTSTAGKTVIGWDLSRNIELKFRNPLDKIYRNTFIIKEDSTDNAMPVIISFDSLYKNKIIISYAWKPDTKYSVYIPPGATKDIYGLLNDSISFSIVTKKTEDYATVKCNTVNTFAYPVIIELLRKDMSVVTTRKLEPLQNTQLQFIRINAEAYTMRAIIDVNSNGKWDTGDLSEQLQPEPIIFYPVSIATKANWEIELKWEIK